MKRASILAAAAAAALLAAPARADYKESYRKGIEAADKGNWPEVARRMREALAEQPREGESIKLYGMRFEDYLPQYYLGLALFNAGDCAGALQAWTASENQGPVKKSGQYKNLTRNRQTCQAKLAKARPTPSATPAGPDPAAVAQAVQAAQTELTRAEEAARGVAALAGDRTLSAQWAGDPQLGGAEKQAHELIASARSRLEAGQKKPDLGALGEAQSLAGQAAHQLEAVRTLAGQRREARLAEEKATPAPAPPSGPSPGGPASRGPLPAELLTAGRAYFSGQYQQAADALARSSVKSGRAGAQALLLRGAARYALYVMGGQKDDGLRRAALTDVQACRRLDPSFAPDPQFFSPRFREFFLTEQGGAVSRPPGTPARSRE